MRGVEKFIPLLSPEPDNSVGFGRLEQFIHKENNMKVEIEIELDKLQKLVEFINSDANSVGENVSVKHTMVEIERVEQMSQSHGITYPQSFIAGLHVCTSFGASKVEKKNALKFFKVIGFFDSF